MNAMDGMDEQTRDWYQAYGDMPEDVRHLCEAPPDEGRVKFAPWVGRHYHKGLPVGDQGQRMKLLVLGESHYDAVDHWAFTRDVVMRQWESGSCRMPRPANGFFSRVERLIRGVRCAELAGNDEIESFYQEFAFYNYLQKSLEKSDDKPKKLEIKESYPAFLRVLDVLSPDVVLILGFRLWDGLPVFSECDRGFEKINEMSGLFNIEKEGLNRNLDIWRIHVSGEPVAFPVLHPSRQNRYWGKGDLDRWGSWTLEGFKYAVAWHEKTMRPRR